MQTMQLSHELVKTAQLTRSVMHLNLSSHCAYILSSAIAFVPMCHVSFDSNTSRDPSFLSCKQLCYARDEIEY